MPDEERRQIAAHLVFQAEDRLQGGIVPGQVGDGSAVGLDARRNDRVAQHNSVGAGFLGGDTQGFLHGGGVPQNGGGRGQVPASREAADRDLERVQPQFGGVAAQMQDGAGGVDQRLPAQRGLLRRVGTGVFQHKGLIARLQKLHGDGVCLPRAAKGIPATGQNQHRRADIEGRHLVGFVPQVAGKFGPARESVGV